MMYVFDKHFHNLLFLTNSLTFAVQGNYAAYHCATVTEYKDLSIDNSGYLHTGSENQKCPFVKNFL